MLRTSARKRAQEWIDISSEKDLMSCSEDGDKDSDYEQEASDKGSEDWESGGETQPQKASATVPQGDDIMLAQMETGTDQDCTDQESKDQKTAEQFRSASAPTRTKRQRKTIPIEKQRKRLQLREKVEIYKKITENHMSYKQVEENYGISRTAVKQIKRNGPELMQQLEKEGRRGTTKTVRKIPFPLIEDGVLEYFELARKNCLPVTRRSLMTMGQVIKQRLLQNHQLGAAERAEIQEFTASLHWARNVITRNGLRHVRLWGEAGSVDSAAIAQEMENLRQKLASYELKLIFNMDETGLFFKMLPRTTYLSSKEDCATTRGQKE